MALDRDLINVLIAEAGGNIDGLHAVSAVIQNRAAATGKTPAQVVRQHGQFQGYSNPGSASVKAQSDPQVRALAEKAYNDIASGAVPDPTNGGTSFRAANAAKGMSAPHGTVDIGGNRFAKGSASPQTALSAINTVAPTSQPRPVSALGYEPPQPTIPSVRAITVNPNGSPQTPQMVLPQAAMYGINRLDPNHVTHQPTDFTTQNVGVPDARLSQLSAPFPQPPSSFAGSSSGIGASGGGLVSRPVHTVAIDPMTGNPIGTNQPQSLQDALNVYAQRQALNTNGGSVKTTSAQAGNVALPKGVVPKQAAADLAAISAPSGGAFTTGWGSSALLPHTAVPNQSRIGVTPSPVLSFNGDQNTGIPGVAAMPPANALPILKAPVPHPYPIMPTSRPPSPGLIPLTHFNTVNPTSQIIPQIGSAFNSTPIGHIASLVQGQPIQGGLLGMLFNKGGLLAGPNTVGNSIPAVPQPISALVAQQSPDQRGLAALQAAGMGAGQGGSSGGAWGVGSW